MENCAGLSDPPKGAVLAHFETLSTFLTIFENSTNSFFSEFVRHSCQEDNQQLSKGNRNFLSTIFFGKMTQR